MDRSLTRKSGGGCCPFKAANKNRNASSQWRWRSCNKVTKRPAAGHGLKITKRPAVRYFSIFVFEIQKIFIRKCSAFIYNPQALPAIQGLDTWNFSITRPDTVLKHFSLKYTNFPWKIFYLYLEFLCASRKWKNSNVIRFADPVHRVERDPSVTLRNYSDTTGQNPKFKILNN